MGNFGKGGLKSKISVYGETAVLTILNTIGEVYNIRFPRQYVDKVQIEEWHIRKENGKPHTVVGSETGRLLHRDILKYSTRIIFRDGNRLNLMPHNLYIINGNIPKGIKLNSKEMCVECQIKVSGSVYSKKFNYITEEEIGNCIDEAVEFKGMIEIANSLGEMAYIDHNMAMAL